MHVLIIGAGCTGLLIAQGLRKHNISCCVYERSPKDRSTRDWGMMLHWGKEHLQKTLPGDMAARFLDKCNVDTLVDPTPHDENFHPVYNGKTGAVVVNLPWPPIKRYSRAKIVGLLSENLNVHYYKKLVDIHILSEKPGVQAVFEDGTIATGDLLIGADSANSFVRSWLFNHADFAQATQLPLNAYNFPTTFPADLAMRIRNLPHPLQCLTIHPDHPTWFTIMSLDVRDPEKPEERVFQMWMTHWTDESTPETSEERLKHSKMLGETYTEPFKSAVRIVKHDTFIPKDRLKYWKSPQRWSSRGGRVTLAGDAGHPFPPHRGQGLNNAFQDAANLVEAIASVLNGEKMLEDAIDGYEEEMFERGKQEIEVSVKQAYAATHLDTFLESAAVRYGVGKIQMS